MNKSRGFLSILIPSATVFISSFCIMVLELVASRLIARHLGSSLYTWTAVIGVVLAGITIGNYLGGRIADRFQAKKALAVLFAISSAACVITVILNNVVAEWTWLWHFSWPARTFTHVSLVFLLPSVLLGTISPVVAKMALDRGLATGRTVGDIYAWGAAGSIAGTFAAGYYLIATMGTVAIIWAVAAALLLMAILYWVRFWLLYLWAVFSQDKDKLSVLIIGGGGYVFPRYVEKLWPGSRVDVAEIDPGVTEAAMEAFGLERDTSINIFTMDARNYVDELLYQERIGEEITRYDFIYEDAFDDYSVPYQLVTKEFNDKINRILKDDGVYLINMIDFFDSGLFLGAYINTLQQTFPYVYAVTEYIAHPSVRETYVIVASKRLLDLKKKIFSEYQKDVKLWYLSDSDLKTLKEKSHGLILTDDYVPIENLLAPVVHQGARELLAQKLLSQAEKLAAKGEFDESIEKYEKAISLNPMMSIKAYNDIGFIQAQTGRLNEAAETFRKAIKYDEQTRAKQELGATHHSLAVVLKRLGQTEEAKKHFSKAVEELRRALEEKPLSFKLYTHLGNSLAAMGDFRSASEAFKRALDLNRTDMATYYNLTKALEFQGRYDEAIEVLGKGIEFMSEHGQIENTAKIRQYLELLEYKKSKQGIK